MLSCPAVCSEATPGRHDSLPSVWGTAGFPLNSLSTSSRGHQTSLGHHWLSFQPIIHNQAVWVITGFPFNPSSTTKLSGSSLTFLSTHHPHNYIIPGQSGSSLAFLSTHHPHNYITPGPTDQSGSSLAVPSTRHPHRPGEASMSESSLAFISTHHPLALRTQFTHVSAFAGHHGRRQRQCKVRLPYRPNRNTQERLMIII